MVQLTQEQLDALHAAADQIALIESEINKAERAGIDVTELRAQLAGVKKAREGLLNVYGGTIRRRTVG